jgi:hypothetical protein
MLLSMMHITTAKGSWPRIFDEAIEDSMDLELNYLLSK